MLPHLRAKQVSTHLAILGKINFKGLSIVFEPKGGHSEQDILAVDGLPLLLLTLFGS